MEATFKNQKPFYFNNDQFEKDKKNLENKRELIQSAIDGYYNVSGITELSNDELNVLFDNPIVIIGRKVIENSGINFKGLKIRDEKLFDVFEKPQGTSELIDLILKTKDQLKQQPSISAMNFRVENFCLEGKKVVVKEETIELIKRINSRFFQNENQEKAFKLLSSIAENINQFRSLTGGYLDYVTLFKDGLYHNQGLLYTKVDAVVNVDYIGTIK